MNSNEHRRSLGVLSIEKGNGGWNRKFVLMASKIKEVSSLMSYVYQRKSSNCRKWALRFPLFTMIFSFLLSMIGFILSSSLVSNNYLSVALLVISIANSFNVLIMGFNRMFRFNEHMTEFKIIALNLENLSTYIESQLIRSETERVEAAHFINDISSKYNIIKTNAPPLTMSELESIISSEESRKNSLSPDNSNSNKEQFQFTPTCDNLKESSDVVIDIPIEEKIPLLRKNRHKNRREIIQKMKQYGGFESSDQIVQWCKDIHKNDIELVEDYAENELSLTNDENSSDNSDESQ